MRSAAARARASAHSCPSASPSTKAKKPKLGFTIIPAEGAGSQGQRIGDIPETANILIKAIVNPRRAELLIERLWKEFMPRFAMVVWEEDIRVLRPDKF
jgi:hypothetical protein